MAKEYAKSFYRSVAWFKCRSSYIKKVFGLCERCGEPGHIVHHKKHITEKNINDPNVTLNHDNLEYLCLDCHNAHHRFNRERVSSTREGFYFNDRGELEYKPPIDKKVGDF